MSKRFLVVNLVLAAVTVFFAATLVRNLTHTRSLPPSPAPRKAAAALPPEQGTSPIAGENLALYNVIVAKHLFNPSRSENTATTAAAPAPPPPPKPVLMGVVVDGDQSRAYLKEMTTERVLSYRIGDTVSGGRLEKITDDMVVIVRPSGPIEVMLRDPSKPKPPPPAAAAGSAPPAAGTPGVARIPGSVAAPPASVTPPSAGARPPSAVTAPSGAPTPPAAAPLPDNSAFGRGRGGGGGRGR